MIQTQDHCHIGITLGGAPENSPSDTFPLVEIREQTEIYMTYERSINGSPIVQMLVNSTGSPKVYGNISLVIKFYGDNLETGYAKYLNFLKLKGQAVHFVHPHHPDDGEDHAAFVKPYLILDVRVTYLDPKLNFCNAQVELWDVSSEGAFTGDIVSAVL